MNRHFIPSLSAIVGAVAITASGASMANDRFDIADATWPTSTMSAPMADATYVPAASERVSVFTSERLSQWYHEGPLTREQVKADLMAAREAGAMSNGGEAGDTAQVIAARDQLNETQAEAIVAEYQMIDQRILAEREAERQLATLAAEEPAGSDADMLNEEYIESDRAVDSSSDPSSNSTIERTFDHPAVSAMPERDAPLNNDLRAPADATLPPSSDDATAPESVPLN